MLTDLFTIRCHQDQVVVVCGVVIWWDEKETWTKKLISLHVLGSGEKKELYIYFVYFYSHTTNSYTNKQTYNTAFIENFREGQGEKLSNWNTGDHWLRSNKNLCPFLYQYFPQLHNKQ